MAEPGDINEDAEDRFPCWEDNTRERLRDQAVHAGGCEDGDVDPCWQEEIGPQVSQVAACGGNIDGDDWCGEGGGPPAMLAVTEPCSQNDDDGQTCSEHRALKALADANGCSDGINDEDCWENGSRALAGFPGDLTASVLAGMSRA